MISSKTIGLEEVSAHLRALENAPSISAGCAAEGYHPATSPNETPVANATIINSQAKNGRVPVFVDPESDVRGGQLVSEMAAAWTNRQPGLVYQKAQELAKLLVDMSKRHINAEQSEFGPMPPLTPKYAAIKKFKWKAGGKPILVRTGALLASLVTSLRVSGGGR